MNRPAVVLSFALLFVSAGLALAHEGHTHTVMGTVSSCTDTQLVVKKTDGKDAVITLNAKTTVTKGDGKLTLKDVAVGQRVVVDVGDGKTPLVARGIKLGVAPAKPRS
jgi:hypothetical protein